MTIAKSYASKLVVALVALAMVFAASASTAKAQTTEDLQKMINDLLAQVSALQTQTGGSASAAGVCPFTWTRDLSSGSTGTDVKALQQFLNADPDTRVSATGVGSAGSETEFYGPATGAAVSKFQVKYRSEILSPAGLVNPTAYFGPGTRAKANALCVASAPVDDGDDDSDDSTDDDSDDDSDNGGDLQGEANLEDFEVDDASDTEIEEGQEDVAIGEFTVRFENGDGELDRIDVELLADGETDTTDVEPWDVFDSLSLWIDGDMVAEEETSDENDWLDEDEGLFRFSNLGIIGREEEDVEITLAATINDGLETTPAEIGDWDLQVEEVRYFDADGVSDDDASTDGIGSDTATFEIQEEGGEDEIFVRSSTNDPDSTTLELEDDETSDFMTVFVFELDTEDSVNDIMVEGLRVAVTATEDGTTATSAALLIDDVQLVVDGEIYDDWTASTSGPLPDEYVFDLDDEDFIIEAGESVEVEFQVEFEALGSLFEGATVEASADSANVDAEGAESLTGGQLSGSATGEEHTLRTEGVVLELTSVDEVLKVNDDQDVTDDEGVFTIKFDVTAFESDIYVNKSGLEGTTTLNTDGVNYRIEDGSGTEVTTGTTTESLTSTADTEGTRFIVEEGETETFTLSVEFDPATSGFHQLQLWSLNFNIANSDPNESQRALDESDYETDSLSI
ncbi:MAG: hypothetical protein AAB388_00405 [Patescibacteria group bacterium]